MQPTLPGSVNYAAQYAPPVLPSSPHIDLSLPKDFGYEMPPAEENIFANSQDNLAPGSYKNPHAMTEFSFLDTPPARPEPQPMSKGEFISHTRDAVEGLIGSGGLKAVETVGGLAHIANGGKVTYSKKLDLEGFDSSTLKFQGSFKDGGRVGVEFKATF